MAAVVDALPGGRGVSGNNKALGMSVFPYIRAWWSLLSSTPSQSFAQPNSQLSSHDAISHGQMNSPADSEIEPTEAASSVLAATITPDFENILASITRASILSALPLRVEDSVSAPRLCRNPHFVDTNDNSVGSPLPADSSASWVDSCSLASKSWLADMANIDVSKELAVIRRYILRVLPDLVSVDETAAATLVLDLLGADQAAEVIPALDRFPRLQVRL